MSNGGWFRRKKKGVGWTPNNWKGWAVLVIGIAIVIALAKCLSGLAGRVKFKELSLIPFSAPTSALCC